MNFIHHTSVIYPNVIIEDDVYIGEFCLIGSPPEWKGREGENKGVVIKKGTRITGMVTIDGGADRPTVIGESCYLLKHSHVGHDAELQEGVTLSRGAKIGGHSIIGRKSIIGLNAVVHQRVTVPEGCKIGASAFIGKKTELKPFTRYAGVPAREIGSNK